MFELLTFKVTIKNADKNPIFNPEFWDEGIIVKPFRERNTHHPNTRNNNTGHIPQWNKWNRWQLNLDKPFESRWGPPIPDHLKYDNNQPNDPLRMSQHS